MVKHEVFNFYKSNSFQRLREFLTKSHYTCKFQTYLLTTMPTHEPMALIVVLLHLIPGFPELRA